jgi:hypothetical protein
VVNENRLRDTQILDMLLRLAKLDAYPTPRSLEEVVEWWTGLTLEESGGEESRSTAEARLLRAARGEWEALEERARAGLARDALLAGFLYQRMFALAVEVMDQQQAEILPDAVRRFGPLTECVQVKADIVLREMRRTGLRVDLRGALQRRAQLERELAQVVERLRALGPEYDLFTEWQSGPRRGELRRTARGKPMIRQERLEEVLLRAADEVFHRTGFRIPVPLTDDNMVSLSSKRWAAYARHHPFIQHWVELERVSRLLNFVAQLDSDVARSEYALLVRNGRCSCASPNVHQCPRQPGFRDLFIARPGHVLLALDYSFIELCTLAAVCEHRYGASELARVIREGVDPHCFTAAMFEGVSLDEFMSWKSSEREELRHRFEQLRQRAKAINFGIPGGQGAAALVEYALSSYGVELSLEQARRFRERLITQVYPELSHYLFEDRRFVDTLAFRLEAHVNDVWAALRRLAPDQPVARIAGDVRNVIAGRPRPDGVPYEDDFIRCVWEQLRQLNRNSDLEVLLRGLDEGSDELSNKLFGLDVATLTGRVRGGVGFTQAANTPFSGLAADGAKLALWNLLHAGFRPVAFVHDEILIELPEAEDYSQPAELAAHIMCISMQEICRDIPIACKFAVARNWSRQAVAVRDERGRLIAWEPDRAQQPHQ